VLQAIPKKKGQLESHLIKSEASKASHQMERQLEKIKW